MLFRLVTFSVVGVLTRSDPLYSDFVILSDAEECHNALCLKEAGEVSFADIEACLEASPVECTFKVSFVNSGTTGKVCGTSLGFSLEEMLPLFGTMLDWMPNHTPEVTINQGAPNTETCGFMVYATDSCEDTKPETVGGVVVTTEPFRVELGMLDTPSAVLTHTHIVLRPNALSAICQQLIVSVDFADLGTTLTLMGRFTSSADVDGNGDLTEHLRDSNAASANLLTGSAFSLLACLMM